MLKNLTAASLVLASLVYTDDSAAAAPKKKTRPPSMKTVADAPSASSACPASKRAGRVRADVLYDVESGEILASKLYDLKSGEVIRDNLTETELKETEVRPASLTKIQSVMTMMRKILSGEWLRDSKFNIFFGGKKVEMTPTDLALASLNPSANVMDQVATREFIDDMNDYMHSKGMTGTTYLNATGYPTTDTIRKNHKTTLHDLVAGIVDFERSYNVPAVLRQVFGRDQITGLWEIDVPGLSRTRHTISVLETAEGKRGRPIPGVIDGKSGTTCNFGSGAYVTYRFNAAHRFGFLTIGHDNGQQRDRFIARALEEQRPLMEEFARRSKAALQTAAAAHNTSLPIESPASVHAAPVKP